MRAAGLRSAPANKALVIVFCVAVAHGRSQIKLTTAPVPPAATYPATPAGPLVLLDRVVAVINGDVILESDVQEEMRFISLQPGRADPAGNTPQSALRRLIDRDLILQQMKLTQMIPATPTTQQVDQQLSELRKQIPDCAQFHCETEEGWQNFLKAHGLTESEVQAHWRERMLILAFIQARFGAGVRISQAEIEEYYDKNFAPEFAKRKLQPPPLKTVSSRIQEILLQQRVNTLLQDWLQSLKDEGNVSILGAVYNEPSTPKAVNSESGGQQ